MSRDLFPWDGRRRRGEVLVDGQYIGMLLVLDDLYTPDYPVAANL
jgi:hypothetical protein